MTQCKLPKTQVFLLPNIIIMERNEEWTSWALQKCEKSFERLTQSRYHTPSPSITYQGFVTGAVEAPGDSPFLSFMSICALLRLAWGDNTYSPEWFHDIPEADLLLCISVEKIRHHQCTCPLWIQKQHLVLQIKWCSTVQKDFLSSFLLSI